MATQPLYLNMYMMMRQKTGEGRYDARTREAIALAVARFNECAYCVAAHTNTAVSVFGIDHKEVDAWQNGLASDPDLASVLSFVTAVLKTHGAVTDADLTAIRQAGATDADIIEILAVIMMNIATNYLNRLAQTEIDFPTPDGAA